MSDAKGPSRLSPDAAAKVLAPDAPHLMHAVAVATGGTLADVPVPGQHPMWGGTQRRIVYPGNEDPAAPRESSALALLGKRGLTDPRACWEALRAGMGASGRDPRRAFAPDARAWWQRQRALPPWPATVRTAVALAAAWPAVLRAEELARGTVARGDRLLTWRGLTPEEAAAWRGEDGAAAGLLDVAGGSALLALGFGWDAAARHLLIAEAGA